MGACQAYSDTRLLFTTNRRVNTHSRTHNGATAIPADMFQTNSFLTRSSFFGARPKARTNDRRTVYTKAPQAKVGLFFSTTSGNCEYCAEWIQSSFEPYGEITEPMDIADVAVSDLSSYDSLIVGAPTWHTGADEGRSGTAWDEAYGDIRSLDLSGKKVAVFGVGDSSAYGEYFCDAIEELHSTFRDTGAEMCGGNVSKDDYDFADSKALVDGVFIGLPFDEDNESHKSEERAKNWCKQLSNSGFK